MKMLTAVSLVGISERLEKHCKVRVCVSECACARVCVCV